MNQLTDILLIDRATKAIFSTKNSPTLQKKWDLPPYLSTHTYDQTLWLVFSLAEKKSVSSLMLSSR